MTIRLAVALAAVLVLQRAPSAAVVFQAVPGAVGGPYGYSSLDSRLGASTGCVGTCSGAVDQALVRLRFDADAEPITEIWVELSGSGPGGIVPVEGASWIAGCPDEVAPTSVTRYFDPITQTYTRAAFIFSTPIPANGTSAVLQLSVPEGAFDSFALLQTWPMWPGSMSGWAAFTVEEFSQSAPCESAPCSDSDGDGEADATDRCAGTAPGVSVDDAGCSLDQFCGGIDATTAIGVRTCRKADWKNDEPVMRRVDSDCVVDRGGKGSVDDVCVPAP